MTVTKRNFTDFLCARQLFVNNAYSDFHKNPRNGLVADTKLVIDGQTDEVGSSLLL
jgi:hypothetical protein